jgi:hypothetical protein
VGSPGGFLIQQLSSDNEVFLSMDRQEASLLFFEGPWIATGSIAGASPETPDAREDFNSRVFHYFSEIKSHRDRAAAGNTKGPPTFHSPV